MFCLSLVSIKSNGKNVFIYIALRAYYPHVMTTALAIFTILRSRATSASSSATERAPGMADVSFPPLAATTQLLSVPLAIAYSGEVEQPFRPT